MVTRTKHDGTFSVSVSELWCFTVANGGSDRNMYSDGDISNVAQCSLADETQACYYSMKLVWRLCLSSVWSEFWNATNVFGSMSAEICAGQGLWEAMQVISPQRNLRGLWWAEQEEHRESSTQRHLLMGADIIAIHIWQCWCMVSEAPGQVS